MTGQPNASAPGSPPNAGGALSTGESKDALALQLAHYSTLHQLINTEGSLIWSRYNTMLTVNAVFVALLGSIIGKNSFDNFSTILLLVGSFLGLYITTLWMGLNARGWGLQKVWIDEARRQNWDPFVNPYAIYDNWKVTRSDSGNQYAVNVVRLFQLIYWCSSFAAIVRLGHWLLYALWFLALIYFILHKRFHTP